MTSRADRGQVPLVRRIVHSPLRHSIRRRSFQALVTVGGILPLAGCSDKATRTGVIASGGSESYSSGIGGLSAASRGGIGGRDRATGSVATGGKRRERLIFRANRALMVEVLLALREIIHDDHAT